MRRRHLIAAVPALLACACVYAQASSTRPTRITAEQYAAAAQAHGVTFGPLMAAHTIYVFFDPMCPHCAHLWQMTQPLHNKVKMVWIPIGTRGRSFGQGAAILSAENPAAKMAENEQLTLDGKGGIAPLMDASDDLKAKLKANTDLFATYGEDKVPLVVFKNAKSGDFGLFTGGTTLEQLAMLVGV